METEKIIKSLGQLNLTSYETKSYLALLGKDNLTAIEVARVSGVPRGRIYEVLNNLLEKGLCLLKPDKVKKYRAVDPEVFRAKIEDRIKAAEQEIEFRKREYNANIERKLKQFDSKIKQEKDKLYVLKKDTNDVVNELRSVYKKGRVNASSLDYVEIIREPVQAHRRVVELGKKVEQEVLMFSRPPFTFLSPEAPETIWKLRNEQFEGLYAAAKRGVVQRNIWETQSLKHMLEMDKSKNSSNEKPEPNIQTRIKDSLPIKMAVYDRRYVLYPLIDPIESSLMTTTMIVEHPDLARAFVDLFEYHWAGSQEFLIEDNQLILLNDDNDGKEGDKTSS